MQHFSAAPASNGDDHDFPDFHLQPLAEEEEPREGQNKGDAKRKIIKGYQAAKKSAAPVNNFVLVILSNRLVSYYKKDGLPLSWGE